MEEDIKKILESAACAPSGGNSQPWNFRVNGSTIEVIALPEKDHRILNFKHRGTWVAHGALLENMLIAASALGWKADYEIFPDKDHPNLTIRMNLVRSEPHHEPLYEAIPLRATNRKAYRAAPLTEAQKKRLADSANGIPGVMLRFVEDPESLENIARAVSMNEVVTLENKTLHGLFMKEIVWTEAEERARGGGLFLKTMELAPPQQFAIRRFFSHWPLMNIFNKIGMARTIARDNAKVYAQAAAMGAIMTEDSDRGFFEAGRAMQRIWLEATGMKLCVQLMSGILFLFQRLQAGDFPELSPEQADLVGRSYQAIEKIFNADRPIALVFRIGEGEAPSAYSYKKPPTIIQ